MQFEFAILTALASRTDGQASPEQLRDEVEALTAADGTSVLEQYCTTNDIDVFRDGLVISQHGALRITDAGRALLHAVNAYHASLSTPAGSPSLKLIDDLIGAEERARVFELDLRRDGEPADLGPSEEQAPSADEADTASMDAEPVADDPPSPEAWPVAEAAASEDLTVQRHNAAVLDEIRTLPPPSHTVRQRERAPRTAPQPRDRFAPVARKLRALRSAWRRHLERETPKPRAARRAEHLNGLMFALLVTLLIILCAGAALALAQIKALKSEITSLQHELFPLKERLARIDQAERARAAENKAASDKTASEKVDIENRSQPAPLVLSREEAQLIRDYIKPAPSAGTAGPPVSPGDPFTGGAIPLPSPVTDKIPKLIGARFAIRNGAIVIVRKDSRQADAVLPAY